MLIFKCVLQPDEVIALQKDLPADEYCLIKVPEEKIVYGIMNEELHSRLMDIVSGETLECLEYLDEVEFRNVSRMERREVTGNSRLIEKF